MKYRIMFPSDPETKIELSTEPVVGNLLKLPNTVDGELEYWKIVTVEDHVVKVVLF